MQSSIVGAISPALVGLPPLLVWLLGLALAPVSGSRAGSILLPYSQP